MSRTQSTPPAVQQLKAMVAKDWFLPKTSVDEIYPGVLLGNALIAKDVKALGTLGVTHVLNAAMGVDSIRFVDTSELFYLARSYNCRFLGVPAMDVGSFQLHRYFNETSLFIEDALRSGGKVLVHCLQGISRSATLVIAYLMIKQGMSVFDAVSMVRSKRNIYPNEGFLLQLYDLDSYHSRLRIAYQQNHYSLR